MLTWEAIPNGQDPLLKAWLLDATTGATMCSKPFLVGLDDLTRLPHELSFGLVGEGRDLLSCGLDGGTCVKLDVDSGEVTALANPESTNGPGRFAASFLDVEIDHSWHSIGG